MPLRLDVRVETWPLAGRFTISRGSRTETAVVVATLHDGALSGRGEGVPNRRYGESPEGDIAALSAVADRLTTRAALSELLPHGSARAALDQAFWALEAKRAGQPVWQLAGLPEPGPLTTAYTISLDTPEAMARQTAAQAGRPLLKIKLGGVGDLERLSAVRAAAPAATLIADANEAWTPEMLRDWPARLQALGVALIEQPLPAGQDEVLRDLPRPVPVCADESCHDRSDLARLAGCYDYINIKLDKTGGLTEALALADAAQARGLGLMVGCMLGTSLAMAPAVLLGQRARFIDLDAPLLLAQDRSPGLIYHGSVVEPPTAEFWGGGAEDL